MPMEQEFQNQTFEKIDSSSTSLPKGIYESCTFSYCQFKEADMKQQRFFDCSFLHCDLSLSVWKETLLQNAVFDSCKMLGIDFSSLRNLGTSFKFKNCHLDHCSFIGLSIQKTTFQSCRLLHVEFSKTDLRQSVFDDCDFSGAIFENVNLQNTDFRSSYNFTIDPEGNHLKGAKFSLSQVAGLLAKYQIKIENT